jgi:hypothetical protein
MQKKNDVMNKVGFGGIINEQGRRKTKTIEGKKTGRLLCCVFRCVAQKHPLARRASSPYWIALHKARRRPSKQMMDGVVSQRVLGKQGRAPKCM